MPLTTLILVSDTLATLLRPYCCSSASWTSGLMADSVEARATAAEALSALIAKVSCSVPPFTTASAEAVKSACSRRAPAA